jgi:hypothetical protein
MRSWKYLSTAVSPLIWSGEIKTLENELKSNIQVKRSWRQKRMFFVASLNAHDEGCRRRLSRSGRRDAPQV